MRKHGLALITSLVALLLVPSAPSATSSSGSPYSLFARALFGGGGRQTDYPVVNTGGQLDRSFGTGGKIVADLGAQDLLTAVAVQRDGKVVVGGFVQDPATSAPDRWVVA